MQVSHFFSKHFLAAKCWATYFGFLLAFYMYLTVTYVLSFIFHGTLLYACVFSIDYVRYTRIDILGLIAVGL